MFKKKVTKTKFRKAWLAECCCHVNIMPREKLNVIPNYSHINCRKKLLSLVVFVFILRK